MKTRFVLALSILFLNLSIINAQFKIGSTVGNAGLGVSSLNSVIKLDVYNSSENNYTIGIYAKTKTPSNPCYSNYLRSIYGYQQSGYGLQYGVVGYTYNSTLSTHGRAFGIYGFAGNATTGYNYGVYGRLEGSGNGTAIYGAVPGTSDDAITGKYAAYFRGDVKCENILWAYDLQESDIRIKKNTKNLNGSLEKIQKLNGISYELKSLSEIDNELGFPPSQAMDTGIYKENPNVLHSKRHIGLSAQEVVVEFPELVYTDDKGIMGIHYSGLVPVLIESVKEINNSLKIQEDSLNKLNNEIIDLRKQINSLSEEVNNCCQKSSKKSTENDISSPTEELNSQLFQNTPNPFTIDTKIQYFIPDPTSDARIMIHDLQGKEIKTIEISLKGAGYIVIHGSELDPGMYLYTLITDNNIIDTKTMILTK